MFPMNVCEQMKIKKRRSTCSLCQMNHGLECKRGKDTYPIISILDFRDEQTFLHWVNVDVRRITPHLQHCIYTHYIFSLIAYFLQVTNICTFFSKYLEKKPVSESDLLFTLCDCMPAPA